MTILYDYYYLLLFIIPYSPLGSPPPFTSLLVYAWFQPIPTSCTYPSDPPTIVIPKEELVMFATPELDCCTVPISSIMYCTTEHIQNVNNAVQLLQVYKSTALSSSFSHPAAHLSSLSWPPSASSQTPCCQCPDSSWMNSLLARTSPPEDCSTHHNHLERLPQIWGKCHVVDKGPIIDKKYCRCIINILIFIVQIIIIIRSLHARSKVLAYSNAKWAQLKALLIQGNQVSMLFGGRIE